MALLLSLCRIDALLSGPLPVLHGLEHLLGILLAHAALLLLLFLLILVLLIPLILLILLIGSVLMLSLGLIGYYLAQIYNELKNRPRYLISEVIRGNN